MSRMNAVLFPVLLLATANLVCGDNVKVLTSAVSYFSQQLYQTAASNESSVVISGYSAHSALAMTSLGAQGDTATELSQTLGLTALPGNTSHDTYRDLINQLNGVQDITLNTANALFANPRFAIEPQFVSDAQDYYLADVDSIDLAAPEGPEAKINAYVENKTQGIIKDLLQRGDLDPSTVTVLVNAIFFNGTWQEQFRKSKTQKRDFELLDGTTKKVDMMTDDRTINIKRNVFGADVAELSCVGDRFALYIALPHHTNGVTHLENALAAPGNLDHLFQGLTPTRVRLSLPKFKIESRFELKTALMQLGLHKPFDPKTANFRGIITAGDLVISGVKQKVVIDVTESGITAAGATAVIQVGESAMDPKEIFKADHPFVFFIRDKVTNLILFQGKLSD